MRMTPEAHSQVWILGRMIWEGSGVSLEEEVCPWGGLSGFKTQCHSQLVLSDSCYWTKVWALSSYTFPVCCHDVSTLSLWHGESQTTSKLSWSWCFTKMIEKELRSILTQYALFYPHKYTPLRMKVFILYDWWKGGPRMLGFTQAHTLGSRPTTWLAACVMTPHSSVFSVASSGHINTMVI